MVQHLQKPCVAIFCAPSHRLIAAALGNLCEQQGLKTYLLGNSDDEVTKFFDQIKKDGGRLVLVVHGGGDWRSQSAMECTASDLESSWRSICHLGSRIGQEAIRVMTSAGSGTLLFLGHVSATQTQAGCAALGAAQAGLRSFAQSMAREFGPKGVHVVYAKLGTDSGEQLAGSRAKAVALVCWQLHRQHPSTWTHEIDLRPAGTETLIASAV